MPIKYSETEKEEAMEAAKKEGVTIAAKRLGINYSTISLWLRKAEIEAVNGGNHLGLTERYSILLAENRRLKEFIIDHAFDAFLKHMGGNK